MYTFITPMQCLLFLPPPLPVTTSCHFYKLSLTLALPLAIPLRPPSEYSRYLHSHLDVSVAEYNVDQDLPGNFKNHWAKNLPFLIEDYEEQPGLQPHIKSVPGTAVNLEFIP